MIDRVGFSASTYREFDRMEELLTEMPVLVPNHGKNKWIIKTAFDLSVA